ncbi:MAG: uroporphyrinogen decarboxylase, partial [Blastocatellia bacterium]|nr:uroporphyrinogen decarboxylase [Blastocatellia bacterium]
MTLSAVKEQIGNARFQNALARRGQSTPPIWLMRQAGRYHKHYQALRQKHSFMDLCKRPELAAEVALGPVSDFDFDAAILFSDLLFPLEALGMGLEYTDRGPQLGWSLNEQTFVRLRSIEDAWPSLLFQGEAMRATRDRLPSDRSLIGFVGGPWTLFVYAVEGSHKGSLIESKRLLSLFPGFCETMVPLLARNIEMQLDGG